jgi:hypothetical protein
MAGTCSPSRCLATIGGNIHGWEGFMKCAVQMDSGAMIYMPSLIKIGSGTQKLTHRHTDSMVVS